MNQTYETKNYTLYSFDKPKKLSRSEEIKIWHEVVKQKKYWTFIKQYTALIYYMIKVVLNNRNKTLADDVIDLLYIKILDHLLKNALGKWTYKKNDGCRLSTWVASITKNKTMDYLKKRDIYIQTGIDDIQSIDALDTNEDEYRLDKFLFDNKVFSSLNIEKMIDFENKRKLMMDAVKKLPDIEKDIILYHLEGMKNPKIAEELGLTPKRVASLKNKATNTIIEIINKF
jgi:RNA polymerase sigma factor (sigma-70 family)